MLGWNASAVDGAKFDRNELTIWINRRYISRRVTCSCGITRELQFNLLSDVTCVDWYPSEPRFEVVYELRSIPRNKRLRLKVKLEQ